MIGASSAASCMCCEVAAVGRLHEREWRCKGNFTLPRAPQAVFVRNTREAERLTKEIAASKSEFRCRPRAVVPLTVLCQGLLA